MSVLGTQSSARGSLSQATSGLSWVPGLGLAFRFPSPSGQFPLSDRFSPHPSPAASLKSHSFISRVSRFSHKYDLLLPQRRYRSFTSFPAHFFFSHPCFSEGTFWSGCSLYRLGIFILNCENSPFCGNAHPGHALNPSTIKPCNIPPSRSIIKCRRVGAVVCDCALTVPALANPRCFYCTDARKSVPWTPRLGAVP